MIKIICSTCKTDKVKIIYDDHGEPLIQCINEECLDFECVTPLYEIKEEYLVEVE